MHLDKHTSVLEYIADVASNALQDLPSHHNLPPRPAASVQVRVDLLEDLPLLSRTTLRRTPDRLRSPARRLLHTTSRVL
jgi:hypothetical protein